MATVAEVQRERKSYLREFRRRERAADTAIERVERRIFRLLARKTLIIGSDISMLVNDYNDFVAKVRDMEKALADVYTSVSSTG